MTTKKKRSDNKIIALKRNILIVISSVLVIVALVTIVIKSQTPEQSLENCSGDNCVIYLEDPVNKCSWENGKIKETTLIYTPPESMIEVSIHKEQVDTYLKNAQSKGICTRAKE